MNATSEEVCVTDSEGRLTLPKGFANATVLVQVVSDVELVIRKAKVVPLAEAVGRIAETVRWGLSS